MARASPTCALAAALPAAALARAHVGEELREAAGDGDLERAELLAEERGADVEAANEDGTEPLHFAAKYGRLDVAKYLAGENAADVEAANKDGWRPLHLAAKYGHLDVVKYLAGERAADVEAANGHGWRPLHFAAKYGRLDVVEYLAGERAADVEAVNPSGWRPLHFAAKYGHLDVVKYLAGERAADVEAVNPSGWRPLHFAAKYGHLDVVKYLAGERAADVEAANANGWRPLHYAARYGHLEMVEYLAGERAADVEAPDNYGRRPLHYAAKAGHLQVVEYLAGERAADVEAAAKDGRRPLHFAADYGHLKVAEYLAGERHANIQAADNGGWPPLYYAAGSGHLPIVKYLTPSWQEDPKAAVAARASAAEVAMRSAGEDMHGLRTYLLSTRLLSFTDSNGVTALMLAALRSPFPDGNLQAVSFLLDNPVHNGSNAAKDAAGFTARDYGANFLAVQHLLPKPGDLEVAEKLVADPKVWLLAAIVCASGCLALVLSPSTHGHRWSRGARLLAAQAAVPGPLKAASLAFRFAEIVANSVIPMSLAAELPRWLCFILAATLYVAPALRQRSLVQAACPTQWSILTRPPPGRAAAAQPCMGVARLCVVLLAWHVAEWSGAIRWSGKHAVRLVRQNHFVPVRCVHLPVGNSLPLVTWTVAEGNCTVESTTRCARSPNYPGDYPPGDCTIRVGWLPLWALRATAFNTEAEWDTLTLNGIGYSGDEGPVGQLIPTNEIRWHASLIHSSTGWELCPIRDRVCARLPAAAQMWGAYEALLALLGLAWATAAASLVLAHQLRPAPPAEAGAPQQARELAAKIFEVLRRQPDGDTHAPLGALTGAAGPVRPVSKFQLATTFGPVVADVLLDVNVAVAMLRNGDICFAACILGSSLVGTIREVRPAILRALRTDLSESARTGILTRYLLEILDQKRGSQAMVSLLVTTYALPFTCRSARETILGLASLLSSIYGVATYANQVLDLEGLFAEDDEVTPSGTDKQGLELEPLPKEETGEDPSSSSESDGTGDSEDASESEGTNSSSGAAKCLC